MARPYDSCRRLCKTGRTLATQLRDHKALVYVCAKMARALAPLLYALRAPHLSTMMIVIVYSRKTNVPTSIPSSFSTQKFVCTSIRPSLLPYKELNHFEGAASFLADYLSYAPLAQPTELVRLDFDSAPGQSSEQSSGQTLEQLTVSGPHPPQ